MTIIIKPGHRHYGRYRHRLCKRLHEKRNLSPSTKSDNPVPIDHIAKYMIVPSGNALLGQATGDLNLKARNGDRVSFRGSSIYQNSDDAVIIYGFQKYSGDEIFNGNPMYYDVVDRKLAAVPDHTKKTGFPLYLPMSIFTAMMLR
ncbi:hypothetical protein H3Z85_08875 [Chryseobacterium indologenes]|nr:hypothetical protein H3Z85_08875 [Chryseobacterium indologenes]